MNQKEHVEQLAAECAKLLIEIQARRTGYYPPYEEGQLIRDGDYLVPVENGKLKYEDAMYAPFRFNTDK